MPEPTRRHDIMRRQLPARTVGPLKIGALKPRVEPDEGGAARSSERRHLASREALLRRVAVEYREMPGLRLHLTQAQRLFGLRQDICIRVLDALVDVGVLQLDENGAYVRRSVQP
ncbi:MAG: hypothetical protein Q8L86_13425 [Vicinamibacterales bacterium]|nr:hypothetical protein [Vicinamibacterales bacterium]